MNYSHFSLVFSTKLTTNTNWSQKLFGKVGHVATQLVAQATDKFVIGMCYAGGLNDVSLLTLKKCLDSWLHQMFLVTPLDLLNFFT